MDHARAPVRSFPSPSVAWCDKRSDLRSGGAGKGPEKTRRPPGPTSSVNHTRKLKSTSAQSVDREHVKRSREVHRFAPQRAVCTTMRPRASFTAY